MERNFSISNALSVYNVLCMSNEYDHVNMTVGESFASISIFAEYHAPKLQNIKKLLRPACTWNCSFEFKHFEKDECSDCFSILRLTWEF